jgi:TP901 family phage tail tape measure protein
MADRIEQQINNAEKAIDKLNSKITNLKKNLESGDYGAGQIQQMQRQLTSLLSSLERKESRKIQLVSQQEIDRTQKAINTIKTQLESFQRQKQRVGGTLGGRMSDDFKGIEASIKRYETALKSFESRLEGLKVSAKYGVPLKGTPAPIGENVISDKDVSARIGRAQGHLSKEEVERNLNQRLTGFDLTNAELKEKIRQSREIALDVMYGRTGQVGADRNPLSAIDRANQALTSTGPADPYVKGGVGAGIPGLGEFATKSNAAAAATEKLAAAQRKAEERAKAARIEEERLAQARNKFANDPTYRQALEQARARGFSPDDLRNIEDRGGGVQRLRLSRQEGGVNQQFNPYVNTRTGTSTPGLSSQFRTFGSDIARDIGQFTKWSIAVAAVYTPLQKLGELITIMVDNESRLADATIAANIPFERAGELFDTVAVAANQAGEGINTTIDAYTQAIRAAGRYNTEQEKSQKGLALLNDSLILSKLSTLDQAQAIDTLSAALLQSDKQLDEGQELLNKWVRISQVANVTVDGLATGVAVLGDSAETVGLSIDQLNGLIAVLSEQSISGAKEAANTAKALVGAYQSDKAEAALNKYGIALRKANGEVRGFLEIYQELAQLREQGILSEAAVSEVALALGGGGVRRAKDASALINSTERLNELARESAKVTGEDTLANDALAKKLETVQTANTRLANSFQELAQTLGDDGGILDAFKGMINLLTGVTKASDELFTLLGRSGPILATFVTGLAAMNAYYSVGGRKELGLAKLGAGQFGGFLGTGAGQFAPQRTNAFGGGIGADILRMNYRGAGVLGAAGVGLQAASNVQAGKIENAEANIAGGVIGAAIGATLGGPLGLAIGANIGSAVGDAFINAVYEHSSDLQDYLFPEDARPDAADEGKPTQVELDEKSLSDLLDLASKTAGIGGNLKAFFAASVGPGFGSFGGRKESALLESIKEIDPALYREISQRSAEQKADEARRQAEARISGTGGGGAEFAQRRQQNEELASIARQEQLGRLATGQITSAEFGRVSSQLAGFPAASIKSIENFGDELEQVSDELDTATEAYDAFLYISTYGTQEQINNISQYSDDILKLTGYLETLEENPAIIGTEFELSWGSVKIESPQQLEELIKDAQKAGSAAFGVTLRQVQESQGQAVKLPPLVGDYNKPLTGGGQDAAVRRGLDIQQKYLVETGKTTEEIAKFKQAIEEFYTAVDRGLGTAFEPVEGLTQQFYDLGKAAAEAAGELEALKGFGLQEFDVDRGTLERLAQQSVGLGQQWEGQFPGFESKPEDILAITNEGIAKPIHADFRILALLLEKIVDQNQKQLDGQYNIPEGATFWVPLTAAYYRRQAASEGGLGDSLANLDLGDNTNATEQNTQALREAALAFRGDPGYSRAAQTNNARVANTFKGDLGQSREAEKDKRLAVGFRGDPGYSRQAEEKKLETPTVRQTELSQLLAEIKSGFSNLFKELFTTIGDRPQYRPGSAGASGKASGVGTQVPTGATTKLDLRMSSNINLVVDGRVLASTLQTYLASELLRTEQSQGTLTKRFII